MEALYDFLLPLVAPIWLILTPFVAAVCCLLSFLTLAWCFRRHKRGIGLCGKIMLVIALAFCGYTIFNICDFIRYRRCGLAISPINQIVYFLFLPPPNLYDPYSTIPLSHLTDDYSVSFRHRFGGRQMICLNLVNNNPKEFEYENPDKINISFKCTVSCPETGMRINSEEAFTTYYLMPGTNHIPICQYEIGRLRDLSPTYKASIRTVGDMESLLRRFPNSFLSLKNSTTK